MYIDEGIDTGEIIHQVRAKMYHGDTFIKFKDSS